MMVVFRTDPSDGLLCTCGSRAGEAGFSRAEDGTAVSFVGLYGRREDELIRGWQTDHDF